MIQYQDSSLCVFESALFRTTSTVLEMPDLILVVDPTWLPEEVQAIQDFVFSKKANRPIYLLFTHSDYDHILGYGAFPEATIIATTAFNTNPGKQEILAQIRKFDDEYYIQRSYKINYPGVVYIRELNIAQIIACDQEAGFWNKTEQSIRIMAWA